MSSNPLRSVPEDRVNDLLVRARQGDDLAFKELVELFRRRIVTIAYRVVGNLEDAKDISQMVFVKIYHHLDQFDTNRKFFTWLYRITLNAAIDFHRMHGKHKHDDYDNIPEPRDKLESGPTRGIERTELEAYINRILANMSEEQRKTFIMRDVEGFSVEEISKILNRPEATIRWYLHRARKYLKQKIEREMPEFIPK